MSVERNPSSGRLGWTWVLLVLAVITSASAEAAEPPRRLRLSLAEAVEAGLMRNYAMRLGKVDEGVIDARVRGAYSDLFPRIDANARYDRTFLVPNPFAGSGAADFLTGQNTGDWVAYNERVRGGGAGLDPVAIGAACPGAVGTGGALQQIPFALYAQCITQAQNQVRRSEPLGPDDNPFLVENNVRAGLSASQVLYDGAAFAAVDAAKTARAQTKANVERTGQQVVGEITAAYYAVLLAQATVEVQEKSVNRTKETVRETSSRVREGVEPQFQLLSVEVELANLETQLVTARAEAEAAEDALAFSLGIPVDTELELSDPLQMPDPAPSIPESIDEAMAMAVSERPDLKAANLDVELRTINERVTFARYLPTLQLQANLEFVGNIPDNRETVFAPADPNQLLTGNPFLFESESRGIFDQSFWGENFSAGIVLEWNLFEGFATAAQQQEDEFETSRARIRKEQLEQSIRQEVAREQRNVASALERVGFQEKNVGRAELNYRHAEVRVREGVSSQLELRDASQQLDQSRLNRQQAVHDYLVARVNFDVAIGQPPFIKREEKDDE